ncbi:hypothetical protein L249_7195 [Ophiocordyceps polyrhachis-furcata BCC 54312]|uniref:SWR1-complex protein 5 n=1 Tax=Ophiocordyceps polyrhachis-furcata BCC 54312 TaxID=1330021 RepID=A0A367LAM4_9HYPO|nr:hypothetical protein L249_7195 [Ophiocordyceps polyrhachis-furcata BCC 54312]
MTNDDDDEQYISSQDSDFAPDEAPAHEGSDASDSEDEPRRQDGPTKRRRSEAEDEEDGYNNSGDEAVIQKGRKRQKRNKGEEHLYDGGEGGLIKTRRQRAEEKAERHHNATIGPVTVDVDALWEQMTSGKPIPPKDEQPAKDDDRPDESADGCTKLESRDPSNQPDTMVIKRIYNFAGRIHTEEKVVARDSAEGRLHLSTLSTKEAAAAEEEGANARPQTRKAFRSAFEPIVDNALSSSPRTDLDLGLAARRRAAQEAQAKKLNTVEKSRMDWAGYVDREGIQDELALASKSKDSYNAQEVFRRHFEARFQPLPPPTAASPAPNTDEEDADGQDEWMGFSDDDDPSEDERNAIEVVDHTSAPPAPANSKPKRHERKPPRPPGPNTPEDAPSLLAQDVALQRLLSESNLEQETRTKRQTKLFSSGKARVQATKMRILRGTTVADNMAMTRTTTEQKRMPMKMRKGIKAAQKAREEKRITQARENGILVEKTNNKSPPSSRMAMMKKRRRMSSSSTRRDPNAVGTFRRGELRLSQRDVDSIQHSRDVFGR